MGYRGKGGGERTSSARQKVTHRHAGSKGVGPRAIDRPLNSHPVSPLLDDGKDLNQIAVLEREGAFASAQDLHVHIEQDALPSHGLLGGGKDAVDQHAPHPGLGPETPCVLDQIIQRFAGAKLVASLSAKLASGGNLGTARGHEEDVTLLESNVSGGIAPHQIIV
jgi:hypothetical protein